MSLMCVIDFCSPQPFSYSLEIHQVTRLTFKPIQDFGIRIMLGADFLFVFKLREVQKKNNLHEEVMVPQSRKEMSWDFYFNSSYM